MCFFFLLGNVPCPIVYGAVVDSACLVWEYACGERGACWLYDSNMFRMFFHGKYTLSNDSYNFEKKNIFV